MKNEPNCQWELNEQSQLVCSQCKYVFKINTKELSSLPKKNCSVYAKRNKHCIHLGEYLRDYKCGKCKKLTRSIMECKFFGECTISLPQINNIHCCNTCEKYEVQS